MNKSKNKKKSDQLGMNHATASGRLKKEIMFSLLQETGKDICFQCGERIERVEELSVEHKVPWLDSDNPVELFFDLDNIAFSHLSCNSANIRRKESPHGAERRYSKHGCRCEKCTEANKIRVRRQRSKRK